MNDNEDPRPDAQPQQPSDQGQTAGSERGDQSSIAPAAGFFARLQAALTALKRRLFGPPLPIEQPPDECVIIGPIASGKSALLVSLERCTVVEGYSYRDRFKPAYYDKGKDLEALERELDNSFAAGLAIEATRDVIRAPSFKLTATARRKVGSIRNGQMLTTHFSSLDGGGGLLLEDIDAEDEGKYPQSFWDKRDRLVASLQRCSTILLCLPFDIRGFGKQKAKRRLGQYVYEFADRRQYPGLKRFVVCFTKYELHGLGLGRGAYRALATRRAARDTMATHLREVIPWILPPLEFLHQNLDQGVWLTPVSTFGFVPHNGAPNVSPIDGLLLTRAADQHSRPTPDRPFDYDEAYEDFWHPFLTLDPFIFVTTGVADGTLIHSLNEVL